MVNIERKLILIFGIFLLLSLFVVNACCGGSYGVITQPVQKPSSGQTFKRLEAVELWLVYDPCNIRHREVKAIIDGEEVKLNFKNVTFCELWQTSAEVWTANVNLSPGAHTCQYVYIQSVKQDDGFWADFLTCTAEPFNFYVSGDTRSFSLEEPQKQSESTTKSGESTGISITQSQRVVAFSVCLLLALGLATTHLDKNVRL